MAVGEYKPCNLIPALLRANPSIYMYVPFPKYPCNPEAPSPKKHNQSPSSFSRVVSRYKQRQAVSVAERPCKKKKNTKSVYSCGREQKQIPHKARDQKALKNLAKHVKSDACLLEKSRKQRGEQVMFPSFIGYLYRQTLGHRIGKASVRFMM
jgi:hypothetical protein